MEGPIQSISLSLLSLTSDMRENASNLSIFIQKKETPSELLSSTDEMIEVINKIDASLSLVNQAIAQLQSLYQQKMLTLKTWHADLIEKIRERRSKAIQLNTNVEIYDKENPLYRFEYQNGFDGMSNTFRIVEVIKPEDYTVLSVINTIENVEPLTLEKADEFVNMVFSNYGLATVTESRTLILRIKAVLESSEYTSIMASDIYSTECAHNKDVLEDSLNALRGNAYLMKKQFGALFRTFIVMDSNYNLYAKAVDIFSSVALESVFNKYSVYEIM